MILELWIIEFFKFWIFYFENIHHSIFEIKTSILQEATIRRYEFSPISISPFPRYHNLLITEIFIFVRFAVNGTKKGHIIVARKLIIFKIFHISWFKSSIWTNFLQILNLNSHQLPHFNMNHHRQERKGVLVFFDISYVRLFKILSN